VCGGRSLLPGRGPHPRGFARRDIYIFSFFGGIFKKIMDFCEAWNVLWVEGRPGTLDAWRALSEAAEEAREGERESSISVQRVFRGQRVRAWKSEVSAASLSIQRTFRGRRGRLRHAAREALWRDREEGAVLHYFATDCQRAFRGFYSRRYVHDFEARKTYLLSVVRRL
jgi:hypothetical protein